LLAKRFCERSCPTHLDLFSTSDAEKADSLLWSSKDVPKSNS